MLVVDDNNLFRVLAGEFSEATSASLQDGEVFTTGSWYWRAARAVLNPAGPGALDRLFQSLTEPEQEVVRGSLANLPANVGLVGPRRLVPVMASLRPPRRLNLLTAEAVATALLLDAVILVTTESELLTEACSALGVTLRIDAV